MMKNKNYFPLLTKIKLDKKDQVGGHFHRLHKKNKQDINRGYNKNIIKNTIFFLF